MKLTEYQQEKITDIIRGRFDLYPPIAESVMEEIRDFLATDEIFPGLRMPSEIANKLASLTTLPEIITAIAESERRVEETSGKNEKLSAK